MRRKERREERKWNTMKRERWRGKGVKGRKSTKRRGEGKRGIDYDEGREERTSTRRMSKTKQGRKRRREKMGS